MEELKELFGENQIDYATFESKLSESGIELANLKTGAYVSKDKFDKLNNKFEQYKKDNDISKYADYDTIKAEVDALKAEKVEMSMLAEIGKAKVGEKYRKFVLSEVKGLVTEQKDFNTCLAEYLKDNEQFIEKAEKQSFFHKSSSVDLQNGSSDKQSINKKMNDIIRGNK